MATYSKATTSGNYTIYLVVNNVNQDITNNQSKVQYKAYITGASGTSSWGTGSYTVSINGAQTTGSVQYDFSSSKTWYCVGSASAYVTSGYISHNSDGTKSINVSFSFSGASLVGSASINETFTLNTIPRASDVSVSNYSITNTTSSISATITSKANFYHKWRWKIGSGDFGSWTNKGLISTTSSTVTVANTSLLSGMPTSTSATFTIEVRTYSDSGYATLVGTKTATCTVSVNTSNIKPSVSLGDIALNSGPTGLTVPVAGYSTVKSTWGASGGYGTTSNTTYFTVSNGSLASTSSTRASGTVTSNTIPQSASNYTLTINAYSKDSRGAVSDTVSKSITVYGYQPPVADLTAYRVAQENDDEEDGAGTWVYVNFSGTTRSTVNNQNSTQSVSVSYTGSISGTIAGSTSSATSHWVQLTDSSNATFTLTVRDKVTTSTAIVSVAPALYPLDLYDTGSGTVGAAFGTTAESGKVKSALPVFTNGSGWNARFGAIDTQHHGEVDLAFGVNHTDHGVYSTGYSANGTTWTSNGKWLIYRGSTGAIGVNGNALIIGTNNNANFSGNVRAEGYGSFGGKLYVDGGQVISGTLTKEAKAYVEVRTIAGEIYLESGESATATKALRTMNHAGTYKTIIGVDQNNLATFYGRVPRQAIWCKGSGSHSIAVSATGIPAKVQVKQIGSDFTISNGNVICGRAGTVRVTCKLFVWSNVVNDGGMTAWIRISGTNNTDTQTTMSPFTNGVMYLEGIFTVSANTALNYQIRNDSGSATLSHQATSSMIVEYLD